MLDMVRLSVSERAGRLQQKIEPRMVGVARVSSRDKYELFEAGREALNVVIAMV